MIPSVLAHQLRRGMADFLATTFPITTRFFHGVLERLLDEDGGVFQDPYLSIQLPFLPGTSGADHFPDVPLAFPPYLHQERAFARLSGARPRSTLIATGTGSGKTESFLWPILDHCYQHRSRPGIKAILLYPMNALGTDQGKRIAAAIHANPKLRHQVSAGLYIGEAEATPLTTMTADFVITSRDTLRKTPPSILLTNYKMLDYLLVRPGDLPLWQHNGPETLRYLVVDELHTFDGAQGTDLACLIRRLKERLKTPPGSLCCVGTSATLGTDDKPGGLLAYAGQVFGEPFDGDAVVGEVRQSAGQFLDQHPVRMGALIGPERTPELDPDTYPDYESYVRAQHVLWLGAPIPDSDFGRPEWRVALGAWLMGDPLFQNLLKALRGATCSYGEVLRQLDATSEELRHADAPYKTHLLNSLLALVSEARALNAGDGAGAGDGNGAHEPRPVPFLRVRIQSWLREMRRMVVSVSPTPRLRFADDLNEEQLKGHLPVVHCRDCGAMGWAGTKGEHDAHINPDLQTFYVAFFARSPKVAFLFPDKLDALWDGAAGIPSKLCTKCLRLTTNLGLAACPSCPGATADTTQWIDVFHPDTRKKRKDRFVGVHDCPYCGGSNGLTIVGSRAASMAAVLVSQLFASGFNDDKKLLTFSDSVQDAAHRAGFFAARTFRFNFRTALQRYVVAAEGIAEGAAGAGAAEGAGQGAGQTLRSLAQGFRRYWLDRLGSEPAFVATFLAPDLEWLADWGELRKTGQLPAGSALLGLVADRIDWEITSEYGFKSRIGRTLEKTGASVAHADPAVVTRVTDALLEPLRNEVGPLRDLDTASLLRFVLGMVSHLKSQGGILHAALDGYVQDHANTYLLNRPTYMPPIGPFAQTPTFLTNRRIPRFETVLSGAQHSRTWHQGWAEKCFGHLDVAIAATTEALYALVLDGLVAGGLFEQRLSKGDPVWGLNPDALRVSTDVVQLRCRRCHHGVSCAGHEVDAWLGTGTTDDAGAPCLRFHCNGRYAREPARADYYGRLYRSGDVERIFPAEHTGLLGRPERERVEIQFKTSAVSRQPWYPNLLSCTPTLELGIDIGDLSSLILCSVPPAQASYLQRVGRTGRRDGNSLNLTVANARPHDLYFFADPKAMLAGHVETPGVFLEAPAVLERQFTAFCFDRWVESGIARSAIPSRISTVLEHLEPAAGTPDPKHFPHNLLDFIELHRTQLYDRFLLLFELAPDSFPARELDKFLRGGDGDGGDGGDDNVAGSSASTGSSASNQAGLQSGLHLRILDGLQRLLKERRALENNVKLLRNRIKKKQEEPARDLNHERELSDLKREKDALHSAGAGCSSSSATRACCPTTPSPRPGSC